MKRILPAFFLLFLTVFPALAQKGSNGTSPQVPQTGKIKWSVDPFEHALFVENKGQFDTVMPGEQILFEAKLGGLNAFFTAKGVMYRFVMTEPLDFSNGKDPDQDGPPKRNFYYLNTEWEGANSSVTVDADDKQTYYYTYPKGTHDSYIANVYKTITYHNLYPGIDVVYSFPEEKSNLKYTVVVHPGADPNLVHLKYDKSAGMHVDANGNVVVKNDIGTLKESAPVSYYAEDHSPANVSSVINDPDESFVTHNLDATKTLMIDPAINWTTNPNFTSTSGNDYAYDLDWDNAGNVYCYGGGPYPLQLVKLNSAGVIQWTFNATTMTSSTNFYGDFAVDKHSEECYTVEGWNAGGGARVEKVSTGGILMATDPGNSSFNEMWRIVNSNCPQAFEVFGNGTCCPDQAAMLDTTMTTINPANILPAITTGYHDMALCAADPMGGSCWTATTQSLLYTGVFNNYLVKCPVPALSPSTYQIPDGFAFHEIGSIFYTTTTVFNAMNGLACSAKWLYDYNGDTLKQLNKGTGTINAVTRVSTTPYTWGGLDIDLCENVYVGNNNAIDIYNSSLAMTSTLPVLPGIIYDLGVAPYQEQLVYACGQNYVCAISLGPPVPNPITITKGPTTCSACSGNATATLVLCGNPDTVGVTYLWNNGETTRTASALCEGIDTVTITVECEVLFKDTVTIPLSTGGLVVTRDSSNATCVVPGSASITVTGGNPPYIYDWSNGSTTSSTGPVGGGVYCVGVKDQNGCSDSLCITVGGSSLPTITILPNPDTICTGGQVSLTASGGVSYIWTPTTGLSCSTCPNPTATPTISTVYTVVGTDANGCSNRDSVPVDVLPQPVITITAPNDSICTGGSVVLTASGANTYSWAPSTGLSCSNCANPTCTPSVTTSYTVIGTDIHGCTSSATITVYVSTTPVIVVTNNQSICPGGNLTLIASQIAGSAGTYLWEPGGETSASITVSPTVTTCYTVTLTNGCGSATGTVCISISPLPIPSFEADVRTGCPPLCIQFRDLSTITSGAIGQWFWKFGDGDTSTRENPIYCYPDSGTYSVYLTVTTDSGCSATLKILNMITVYSKPVAAFTLTPQPTNILSPTIQFTDKSTDKYGIADWFWTFGGSDDTIDRQQNPVHTYSDTGTFCVQLVVMNNKGCTDTTVNCLVIDPIFALYIPDAFTPNGDGKNDVFMAKGNDIKTFEMYIFDRWGMQLFHSEDIMNGWPGTIAGGTTICQEDTYVYLIKVTDSKDTKHTFIGRVNLIR